MKWILASVCTVTILLMLVPLGEAFAIVTTDLYSCDSVLDGGAQIHKIDKTDGSIISSQNVSITLTFGNYVGCHGLAVDPTDLQMYMIAEDDDVSPFQTYLTTIDPTTGVAVEINQNIKGGSKFIANGINFDTSGQLWATGQRSIAQGGSADVGKIFKMTKATGSMTQQGACIFNINAVTDFPILTYNYDTEKMFYINGDNSNVFFGIVNATNVASPQTLSCEESATNSDYLNADFQDGLTYDTVTGLYYFLNHINVAQDLVTITDTGVTNEVGSDLANGFQHGLAFALEATPPNPVEVSAFNIADTNIDILWAEPNLQGGVLQEYTVRLITPHGTPDTFFANTTDNFISVTGLTPVTDYSFTVDVTTDIGSNLLGNIIDVSTVATQSSGITTDKLYSCDNPNDGGNEIHEIDVTDGTIISSQTITVSGLSQDGCLGLAVDPTDGQMYAVIRDSDRFLVSIDPTTGVGTNIGQFVYANTDDFYTRSINFDIDGQLYVTESETNGTSDDFFKADKTTGIVDTNNQLCDLNSVGNTPFITLNYDTGKMFWADAGSSDIFIGQIDTTFAGEFTSCQLTNVQTDRGAPANFGQGLAYDTVTGDLFFLDNFSSDHDLLRIDIVTGATTVVGLAAHDGVQKGLTFSIILAPATPQIPDPVSDLITGSQTTNSIDLSWTEPNMNLGNFQEYTIRFTTPHGTPDTFFANTTSTSITVAPLNAGTDYSFTVDVTNNIGSNLGGNIVDDTTVSFPPIIGTDKLYSCDNPNDGGNEIHEIDVTDGTIISSQTITVSGLATLDGCLGLAVDPTDETTGDGQMYAIILDSDRFLVSIDPTTGVGTNIGQFFKSNTVDDFLPRSINFDIDGQLYVTDSNTNGDTDEYFKADKTTGIVDTDNLLCDFASNGSTVFMTLNYDTEKMWYVDAGSSSIFIGEIDTTFAGGSCKLTSIETDRGALASFGQGLAYDTVTGDLFFLDEFDDPHDLLRFDIVTGDTTVVGLAPHDGIQKGLTFSLSFTPAGVGSPPLITLIGLATIEADQHNPASYVEFGATCFDLEDGALSISNIDISGIIFTVVATYQVEYECIDSDLNLSTKTRDVNILTAPIHIYTFDGTLADSLGTGNDFVLTDGGSGLNATGWNFQVGDFAQVTGAINEFDYAFEMVWQFANVTKFSEWNQIVEFHDWQTSGAGNSFDADAGIWVSPSNEFVFECDSTCGWDSSSQLFTEDTLHHIIVQRNATTQEVFLYLNGVEIMIANNGVPFPDDDEPEFFWSQDIMTLFATNYIGYTGSGLGHNTPEWAGAGYLNCVNIYSAPMSNAEAIARTSFNPVQCSSQSATAPAYPITDIVASNIQEFQADLTWTEPLLEGNLIEYQVQVITPQGIPVTTFVTTTNTFTTPTELFFGTDYSFDVHAITDSSESFGRQGSIADFTTLSLAENILTLFDQATCEAIPYNGTFSSQGSFDFCGVIGDLFLRGGVIYNVSPNILLSVGDVRIQETSNFNLEGEMTIRDLVLNEGTITNDGIIKVYPIADSTLSALHPAVFADDDGIQSLLDNDGVIINNGLIDNQDTLDQLSIIDNSNSIVNNGQIISACLSTYLGSEPTVNARIIESCLGLIDSFPLDVAWDLSTAVQSDLPLPFQVGLYDSSLNLIGSFTGEITTTGAQNAVAIFNQPIPADGLVAIGVGGNLIKWLGDDTPADFSSSTLPNTFTVDGTNPSSQRTLLTVEHPAQNTSTDINKVATFEQASNIAFTVIAILPVALFFVLFSIFSGRFGE